MTATSVTVTVSDDETVSTGVALTVDPATVSEGAATTTVTVTATLNQAPRNVATVLNVNVGDSSDTAAEGTDYATVGNFLLTINAGETAGTATFRLNPTDDDLDEDNESLTVDGSVTGLSVTATAVTISDNDTAAVTVNPTTLTVAEGGNSTYTVVLASQPTSNVTVALSRTGSPDVTVTVSSLTFTPTNWSTAQTVTVQAADDIDAVNDTATIRHASLRRGLCNSDSSVGDSHSIRRRNRVDRGGVDGGTGDALGERGDDHGHGHSNVESGTA